MVDYSKWDKFVSELSDEDDSAGPVQVHHIEDGGTVTIGPDGPCIDSLQSSNSNLANTPLKLQPAATDEYHAETHIWKQDKCTVTILVEVPTETRGSDVAVQYTKETQCFTLRCRGDIVLDKEFKYRLASDEEDLDWELISSKAEKKKYFQLTVKKYEYIPGSVFWWSCVFKGDSEIDVSTISGRRQATLSAGAASATGKSPTFAENWKKANEMFLEKVAARKHNEGVDDNMIDI